MCQDMQNIDDFKKVLTSNRISFILFCGTFFRREMTNVKQSVRIYNMCCEFMVCVPVQCCALVNIE